MITIQKLLDKLKSIAVENRCRSVIAVKDETDGKDDLHLRKLRQFASLPSPPCQDTITGVAATGTKP